MPRPAGQHNIKVFWPNVGGIQDYPRSTLEILSHVQDTRPSRAGAIQWMCNKYDVVKEFARKLLNVLNATDVIRTTGDRYELTPAGNEFLRTRDPSALFSPFLRKVVGFQQMLRLLESEAPLPIKELERKWAESMKPVRFADNQAPIRYNWLRGFGFATVVAHQILLTERGLKLAAEIRLATVRSETGRQEVSHVDLEDKMKIIGEFFEFEARTRASLNDALPSYALKLKEGDRQLDCLWVRYIPFAGKVKFPVEIQLGGNLADALDRLETVSHHVQKAILVTTDDQEKKALDRLKVKRSPLLEKLTIILVEDVYKAIEATNVLNALAKKIFPD